MQAGVLEYLISINDKGVQKGVTSSERTIKQSAEKISAWTIAKGQMIASALTKTVKTLASTTKQLISSAVMSFANYEQIVGGAKLVWGDAFDFIEKRAKTAYKNVQMSATDYMQQANYYAVGLKNALNGDTEAAAELADKIITAQADIVAALGVDAERVQGAFTGIMRGNYTMLDNLGMGIAGTKQGMQDVIDKVNEWHKAQGRQTKYSMKSIADQQAALVDYVKMQGLAGYAEREGLETIQGSLAATKAAWKDMLTAFGSGVNVAETSRNFTKMLKVTLKNILPVAQRAVKNLFATVKDILPELKEILKSAWTSVKTSVKEFFGDNPLLQKLTGKIDDLMGFADLMGSLFSDFDGTVDKLKKSDSPLLRGFGTIVELGNKFLTSINNAIGDEGSLLGGLFKGTADFIGDTIQSIVDWINTPGNIQNLVDTLVSVIETLLNSATDLIAPLASVLAEVITSDDVWAAVLKLVGAIGAELFNILVELIASVLDVINADWGKAFRGLKLVRNEDGTYSSATQAPPGVNVPEGREVTGTSRSTEYEGLSPFGWVKKETIATGYSLPDEAVKKFQNMQQNGLSVTVNPEADENAADELSEEIGTVPIDVKLQYLPETFRKLVGPIAEFGSFAKGNWRVPYDNFPALLHRDEMVLNKSQARQFRDGSGGGMDMSGTIASAVEAAMSRVYVMLSGEKVGDLTTKRIKRNINASSYSKLRALGG